MIRLKPRLHLSRNYPQQPSPLTKRMIQRLIELSQLSFQRAWNPATAGNFSVSNGEQSLWMSASGVHKGQLRERHFLETDIQTCELREISLYRPSAETELHACIYRRYPEARAVIHAHPLAVVASYREETAFTDHELIKAFGFASHLDELKVPCFANSQDMKALAQAIYPQLSDSMRLFMLQDHGVYAWGKTPDEAMFAVEAFEHLCQTAVLRKISFPK